MKHFSSDNGVCVNGDRCAVYWRLEPCVSVCRVLAAVEGLQRRPLAPSQKRIYPDQRGYHITFTILKMSFLSQCHMIMVRPWKTMWLSCYGPGNTFSETHRTGTNDKKDLNIAI